MKKFVELLEKCEVAEEFYLNNKRKETRESVVHKYCGTFLCKHGYVWKKIFQPNNLKQILSGFNRKDTRGQVTKKCKSNEARIL